MEVRERLYRVDIIKLLGFCFLFFVWKKCENLIKNYLRDPNLPANFIYNHYLLLLKFSNKLV